MTLNIDKSYRLYRLVRPFYPESIEGLQSVQIIHRIISSIKNINPSTYYRVLNLMSGKSDDELDQMESIDLLNLFIDGLKDNQIVSLMGFWDKLNGD